MEEFDKEKFSLEQLKSKMEQREIKEENIR